MVTKRKITRKKFVQSKLLDVIIFHHTMPDNIKQATVEATY